MNREHFRTLGFLCPYFWIGSKHNLRLGPHTVEAVLSHKHRFIKDDDQQQGTPNTVQFTDKPIPEVHINSA
uniref:Ovule protein n=1 Tax=Ascaris lumbricoides TaxID=6252 RepID=A0A0M3HL30_ASCLU